MHNVCLANLEMLKWSWRHFAAFTCSFRSVLRSPRGQGLSSHAMHMTNAQQSKKKKGELGHRSLLADAYLFLYWRIMHSLIRRLVETCAIVSRSHVWARHVDVCVCVGRYMCRCLFDTEHVSLVQPLLVMLNRENMFSHVRAAPF